MFNNSKSAFSELGLSGEICKNLDTNKIITPTPVQAKTIGPALAGRDIIAIAQTGTGKTFAFGLPLIQKTLDGKQAALILLPTRELAIQADEMLRLAGKGMRFRTAVVIGGGNIRKQKQELKARPNIIIATPGRLTDLYEQGSVNFNNITFCVMDEADRMLDMGFAPQIRKIVKNLPRKRQTLMFSATMPPEIKKMTSEFMVKPEYIECATVGKPADKISQEIFIVNNDEKKNLLINLVKENKKSILVFTRTKHGAKKITHFLRKHDIETAEIHGNRTLSQRRTALDGFKSGLYQVLVATDVAARGIDVKEIGLIINFDLPEESENYVHRIGRTGRAGKSGHAISFATESQGSDVNRIEKLIRFKIKISNHPAVKKIEFSRSETGGRSRNFKRSRRPARKVYR